MDNCIYHNDMDIVKNLESLEKYDIKTFLNLILEIKDKNLRQAKFYEYGLFLGLDNINNIIRLYKNDELCNVANKVLNKIYLSDINIKAVFVILTRNINLILKEFFITKNDIEKLAYIKNVYYFFGGQSKLYLYLISFIKDKDILYLLNTNNNQDKLINSEFKQYNISQEITFGVELEVVHKEYNKFKNIPALYKEYSVTTDETVSNGIEVISPILHYNSNDLSTLKKVCDTLKARDFTTDYTCGGHIHIGANYLTSKKDYIMLLYLYVNCENIFYKITDKAWTQKRSLVLLYADLIREKIFKTIRDGTLDNIDDYKEYITLLKGITSTKNYGLNLHYINNIEKNTIEFRMPNGEIDFNELLANITLFVKLISVSHDINMLDNNYKWFIAKRIGSEKNEQKRLELLLSLLFDSEKEKRIYKERYVSNTRISNLTMNNNYKYESVNIDGNGNLKLKKT